MKKDKEIMILRELLRNCKQSDREIAGRVNVSQPTVSRIRSRIEKKCVQKYTIIPILQNMGYEIIAITFPTEMPTEQSLKDSRVLFASHGMGLGKRFVLCSVHKNFSDYMQFAKSLGSPESFLVSTENDIVKHLSFSSI